LVRPRTLVLKLSPPKRGTVGTPLTHGATRLTQWRPLKDDEPRYVPRSIYEGARDMARQIAGSRDGRTAR
jgi:hypothetical protein